MAPDLGVQFRTDLGTPLGPGAVRLMLLGSGEIGREIAIEAIRLGAEVVAVDRYADAPAMQVAHRHHVIAMTDAAALRRVVEEERPDVIVPEIEQIATDELLRLEGDGWHVVPTARATWTTMHRERIRRLASEEARVRTTRFVFADDAAGALRGADQVGFPCVVKATVSSSGHGMTVVRNWSEVEAAYREATEHGRVPDARVMIEEFLPFDQEVTLLVVRHFDPSGRPATTCLSPIGHVRPGTLYHESWQPAELPEATVRELERTAVAVTDRLGGVGVFGVECFVKGDRVYFSEVSPRPHDTGLVTLGSQWNSEFALHARAVLGLPYLGPEPVVPAAAHVILAPGEGRAARFGNLDGAWSAPDVRLFFFGKPAAYVGRRMGVAVARAATVTDARSKAESAAHTVERALTLEPSAAG